MQYVAILKDAFGTGSTPASVGAVTDPAQGARRLQLTIDKTTGAATLSTVSGGNLLVDGYTIRSACNYLAPWLTWNSTTGTRRLPASHVDDGSRLLHFFDGNHSSHFSRPKTA